ncbi:MAG: hypothetical protein LBT90_03250 [Holosporaceae bacterium]|jgi:hypothetical protein|nr:hypothetical protein [Holosporaceae bacterium]
MKQVLTPEDISAVEQIVDASSPLPWKVIEIDNVDTVWVSPNIEGNPIALFDYHSREQNRADARFMVCARDYMKILIDEVKSLRRRVLELIKLNNLELQRRIDLQTDFDELKRTIQDNGKDE